MIGRADRSAGSLRRAHHNREVTGASARGALSATVIFRVGFGLACETNCHGKRHLKRERPILRELRPTVIALLAVVSIGLSPTGASARGGFGGRGFGGGGWHGGGWRGPGVGPALAGGLIAGAVIGGLASSAYAWAPGYGYPGYGYYNGYASEYPSGCPQPGYGEYYNCGAYAVPGYGAPSYYGW